MAARFGLKMVAGIEAAKGVTVLAAGLGLFGLMHQDMQAAADRLVHHLHLNPASHYPRVFIDAMSRLDNTHLVMLALGALVYAAVRLVESYGLWRAKSWAEWFGALSGGIYLPLEFYSLWEGITWPKFSLLCANSLVVGYLVYILVKARTPPRPAAA